MRKHLVKKAPEPANLPTDVGTWTADQVADWVIWKAPSLAPHRSTLENNGFNGVMVLEFPEEELVDAVRELGIEKVIARNRMKIMLKKLRAKAAAAEFFVV